MADSENSRTLPSNRYRILLPAVEQLLSAMAVGEPGKYDGTADEALLKWTAWSRAHSESLRLCNIQQRLESELFRTASKQALSQRDVSDDLAPSAESELAASARRSEATDESTPHGRAKSAEDAASAREQLLATQLWSVSGKSLVSAMAKLHCVLEQGEPVPNSAEFPWPQIRSALADLLMASTLETPAVRDCQAPPTIYQAGITSILTRVYSSIVARHPADHRIQLVRPGAQTRRHSSRVATTHWNR